MNRFGALLFIVLSSFEVVAVDFEGFSVPEARQKSSDEVKAHLMHDDLDDTESQDDIEDDKDIFVSATGQIMYYLHCYSGTIFQYLLPGNLEQILCNYIKIAEDLEPVNLAKLKSKKDATNPWLLLKGGIEPLIDYFKSINSLDYYNNILGLLDEAKTILSGPLVIKKEEIIAMNVLPAMKRIELKKNGNQRSKYLEKHFKILAKVAYREAEFRDQRNAMAKAARSASINPAVCYTFVEGLELEELSGF